MAEAITRADVEELLFKEARLLDTNDYEGWFSLFAPDGVYLVPGGSDDRSTAIVNDTHDRLRERIDRLVGGHAHAQEPRSRTAHLRGNIQILEADERTASVESVFTVTEWRRDVQTSFAGRYHHALVSNGDQLRIQRKRVELVSRAGAFGNLRVLL